MISIRDLKFLVIILTSNNFKINDQNVQSKTYFTLHILHKTIWYVQLQIF